MKSKKTSREKYLNGEPVWWNYGNQTDIRDASDIDLERGIERINKFHIYDQLSDEWLFIMGDILYKRKLEERNKKILKIKDNVQRR